MSNNNYQFNICYNSNGTVGAYGMIAKKGEDRKEFANTERTKYARKMLIEAMTAAVEAVENGSNITFSGNVSNGDDNYMSVICQHLDSWSYDDFKSRVVWKDADGWHGGQRLAWGEELKKLYILKQEKGVTLYYQKHAIGSNTRAAMMARLEELFKDETPQENE